MSFSWRYIFFKLQLQFQPRTLFFGHSLNVSSYRLDIFELPCLPFPAWIYSFEFLCCDPIQGVPWSGTKLPTDWSNPLTIYPTRTRLRDQQPGLWSVVCLNIPMKDLYHFLASSHLQVLVYPTWVPRSFTDPGNSEPQFPNNLKNHLFQLPILIINFKSLNRYSLAKREAPTYSRPLRQVRWLTQR